jgi:hypothetical protein
LASAAAEAVSAQASAAIGSAGPVPVAATRPPGPQLPERMFGLAGTLDLFAAQRRDPVPGCSGKIRATSAL